jgi:DNA-binding NarL/FixJ family response regulator
MRAAGRRLPATGRRRSPRPSDCDHASCSWTSRCRAWTASRQPRASSPIDLDEYVYDALRAGASGFLLKDAPPEQILDAVHVVAAGDALIAPAITRRLIEHFARSAPARGTPSRLRDLTPRETHVLSLAARGLSNAEIASELVLSEATIKTHIKHILSKLHARDRVQAVVIAYDCGLVAPQDPGS